MDTSIVVFPLQACQKTLLSLYIHMLMQVCVSVGVHVCLLQCHSRFPCSSWFPGQCRIVGKPNVKTILIHHQWQWQTHTKQKLTMQCFLSLFHFLSLLSREYKCGNYVSLNLIPIFSYCPSFKSSVMPAERHKVGNFPTKSKELICQKGRQFLENVQPFF